ncbi:MAG: flagellar biosynthesis protein FlhB [Phycisphaerales bacterium]|nr:flagellar biosynthesis protein FlhB [Phycisphaerales bacterium]
MPEDMGEKTEMPTSRRLEEARGKGQIPKSTDFSSAIDMVGAAVLLLMLGGEILMLGRTLILHAIEDPRTLMDIGSIPTQATEAFIQAGKTLAPLLGLMFCVAGIAQVSQVGLVFTTEPLVPKIERLNMVKGLGRLFSRRNLVRSGLGIIKLSVVLAVAWSYLSGNAMRLAVLPSMTIGSAFLQIGRLALELAAVLLAIMFAIGLIDWWYQRWQHTQDLKMTKHEVKDERRSMEGDPKIKGKRYEMMRKLAMQRINSVVPKADVVVTNPTHFSIAIRYDAKTMHAPRVVAKGVDDMAMRIRQVAAAHAVPIVERPPLARGLYYSVEVGQEVPTEFYQAVAELLAYVYNLDKTAAA